MDLELGNKELIEKLPKEGVHCYPANASLLQTASAAAMTSRSYSRLGLTTVKTV